MLNSIYNALVLIFLIESQESASLVQQTESVVRNFRKMLRSTKPHPPPPPLSPASLSPIPFFNLTILTISFQL